MAMKTRTTMLWKHGSCGSTQPSWTTWNKRTSSCQELPSETHSKHLIGEKRRKRTKRRKRSERRVVKGRVWVDSPETLPSQRKHNLMPEIREAIFPAPLGSLNTWESTSGRWSWIALSLFLCLRSATSWLVITRFCSASWALNQSSKAFLSRVRICHW